MTEQQTYRVIADRDRGDDPTFTDAQPGDRLTYTMPRSGPWVTNILDRIERPVPTTDEPTPGELIARERARQIAKGYTAEHDAEHGVPKLLEWAARFAENGEHIKAAAMVEAARAVPAPQPPTREQIAAEVKRMTHAWSGPSMDEFLDDPPTRKQYAIADAVLALLAQPTPTAEPEQVFRCEDCGEEFDYDHYGDVQAHEDATGHEVPSWALSAAEPPRIEDLAPGTTFTASVNGHPYERRVFTYLGFGRLRSDGIRLLYAINAIDPSTIRDVTPPR